MARDGHDFDRKGLKMSPGWGWNDSADPNWRGGAYHGQRMGEGGERAAYGEHRLHHRGDLGGHGGLDGRYDWGEGRFDREGIYHERHEG